MRKTIVAIIITIACAAPLVADEARMLRNPDIHGDSVVFVYAGDLWIAQINGGQARRLTSHVGSEQFPKFSPDGRWIAFSGDYDGNQDVYLIPVTGGEPRRLTFHPYPDQVLEWYPDGKSLLFRSSRNSFSRRFNRLFKIGVEGGWAELQPLPEGELTTFNADAGKIAYNRKSREFRTWKRYHGGTQQDIWIYDFAANSIEKLTDYDGTDAFPMWHNDFIYFVSDRDRVMNLYRYDLQTKETKKTTDFDEYDIKWPSLGPKAIVFENGGWLYTLDLDTEQVRKLSIELFDDKPLARPAWKSVERYIHNFGISPSGLRAVFEARGDIFTVPAENGETRDLTQTPGARETYPAWSPDGKWVAYFSDRSGEYDLYMREASGRGGEVRITSDGTCYRAYPVWSPDSKKILFSDAQVNLFYANIETKQVVKVDHGLHARSTNFIFGSWSPDSRWIAYAKPSPNNLYSIYLYSLTEGSSHQVTSKLTHDLEPVFDPEGKYLFFIANRQINTTWSAFEPMLINSAPARIVGLTLRRDIPSPFLPAGDEEQVKGEEQTTAETRSGHASELKIDLEGIEGRIFDIPAPDAYYVRLSAAKGKLFFMEVTDTDTSPDAFPDDPRIGPLKVYDLEKRELGTVLESADDYKLAADGGKVLYVSGRTYGIVPAAPGQKAGAGGLSLSGLEMLVDYKAEWRQIYNEAWRRIRDWFYDPGFHGLDWEAVKKRYEVLLPYIAHRDDLDYIVGEMVAELSCSHTYVNGGDYPDVPRVDVGLLGCDFQPDRESGYYRFAKIYPGENWNPRTTGPLSKPGIDVRPGDYLIAVNGAELRHPTSPWSLLQNTAGKEVLLTVNAAPSAEGAREVRVTPIRSESALRYIDWVASNREKVLEASGGRIGYIHVPSTSYNGYIEMMKGFYAFANEAEGLIIDGRYNSGGLIPEMFVERLDRPLLNRWATRATDGWKTPAVSFDGPMAYLIDWYAGSGGDAFPYYFKKRGLGPLIGTRTWGGLVGVSGNPPLVDNGSVTMPDFAFVNTEGEWDVENMGVAPDIEVDNLPDQVINGRDPQLERAVAEVLKKIDERESDKPKFPREYPKR